MFCWSLYVLLYFWPLCCLCFFDTSIRILIAPLVSLNSSYTVDNREFINIPVNLAYSKVYIFMMWYFVLSPIETIIRKVTWCLNGITDCFLHYISYLFFAISSILQNSPGSASVLLSLSQTTHLSLEFWTFGQKHVQRYTKYHDICICQECTAKSWTWISDCCLTPTWAIFFPDISW